MVLEIKIRMEKQINKTISPELEKQIEQEAEAYEKEMPRISPYIAFRGGAKGYAIKWEQAEAMVEKMKVIIEELIGIAYPNVPVLKKANQALTDYNTYKNSKDE